MKHILVKYTSRSRPENFERGLKSIIELASDLTEMSVLVSLDSDDERLKEYYAILERYYDKVFIKVYTGTSKNKIDAINRDMEKVKWEWDILVNMSDDQVFIVQGWDNIIRDHCGSHDFLHYPDGNQEALATMSIMGKFHYVRTKYIYHPDYTSVYCDNEAQDVAKLLNQYKFIPLQIFEHLHPGWGKAPNDMQYLKTEAPETHKKDHETYQRRKSNNFDL